MIASPHPADRGQLFRHPLALTPWVVPLCAALAAILAVLAAVAVLLGKGRFEIHMLAPTAVAMAAFLAILSRRTLIADEHGLHYRSNLPGFLARLDLDWSIAWRDITGAAWLRGLAPAQLELATRSGPRRIAALAWQVEKEEARRCERALMQLRTRRALAFDTTMLPLVRALLDHGIDVPRSLDDARAATGFDLAKNPATRGALLLAAVAAAFWFIDASVSNQMYGRHEPWWVLAGITALTAGAAALMQRRFAVPPAPNAVVSAVLAVAVGLAAYEGLQRLNQLADRDGPRPVVFTLERDGTLRSNVAEVRDLPPGFFGDGSFWASQRPGSRHRFGYYRGLGFETLDISAYRARLTLFYGRDPGRDIVRP